MTTEAYKNPDSTRYNKNARCVDCGDTLPKATCLWEAYQEFWCTKCYLGTFQVYSARGLFCIKGPLDVPSVPIASCLAIEGGSRMITTTASEASFTPVDHPDGVLYPTYMRMWRNPDGTRFSTTHLGDGKFLAVGPVIKNAWAASRKTTSRGTQTEAGSSWHWDYDCFLRVSHRNGALVGRAAK